MSVDRATEWSCGVKPLRALAYGDEPADLQVSLNDAARPVVVTRLLLHCLRDGRGDIFPEDSVWQWNLTRRLQGLLGVAAVSCGRNQLVEVDCTNPECGEPLDLDVDLGMFRDTHSPETLTCRSPEGDQLRVRTPSGMDQLNWLGRWSSGTPDEAAMAAMLVESIDGAAPSADWTPDEATVAAIAEALSEADPLTDLRLETECVECGAPVTAVLDLESHVLERLNRRRAHLLDQVHALASEYHWSESDIFSLPGERRRAYLRRLGWEVWG